jgi:hypothetical protein
MIISLLTGAFDFAMNLMDSISKCPLLRHFPAPCNYRQLIIGEYVVNKGDSTSISPLQISLAKGEQC